MDASTAVQSRLVPPAEPAPGLPGERLAGALCWWVDADGRLGVSPCASRVAQVIGGTVASGRVCPESRIGVIERVGARAAVLGLVSREVIDLLAAGFPGVRWAVADVPPRGAARGRPGR